MPRFITKLEIPQVQGLEYQGTPPGIKGLLDSYCIHCKSKDDLMLCSSCRMFFYCCSKSCLEERSHLISYCGHFLCKKISQLLTLVRKEEAYLMSATEHDVIYGAAPENPFENAVGDFDILLEARHYLNSIVSLNHLYFHIAHFTNSRHAWFTSNKTSLELLRLCRNDKLGFRFLVPFQLLHLNRDDDCYAFSKHWILCSNYDSSEEYSLYREDLHRNSMQGDFLYPGNERIVNDKISAEKRISQPLQDCRFNDIEEIFLYNRHPQSKWNEISSIVAVCLIKMRLVAIYDASKRITTEFQSTCAGEILDQAMTLIEQYVMKDSVLKMNVEKQRCMVDRLLDIIDASNPSLLPAILNRERFLEKMNQLSQSSSTSPPYLATEAATVVFVAHSLFQSMEGGMDVLRQRYGDHPMYSTDLLL